MDGNELTKRDASKTQQLFGGNRLRFVRVLVGKINHLKYLKELLELQAVTTS